MKQPYKYWSRKQLYSLLLNQAIEFKISPKQLYNSVYDESWNPMLQFNGCNLVQDDYHPFLPCFIHDYRWVVEGGGIESDREFKNNLIKAGFTKLRANMFFVAVRLGWILYFKWTK